MHIEKGEDLMSHDSHAAGPRYRAYTRKDINQLPQVKRLPAEEVLIMRAVSAVLPFRVNSYVMEELIDWDDVPGDPMYQLTFPQRGMLEEADLHHMVDLVRSEAPEDVVQTEARKIQLRLNPHPAGQVDLNVPRVDGKPVPGIQHKYAETILFFPSPGQTCHAYCTYCFRWAQFVGLDEIKFASREADTLVAYLKANPKVSSVLFTGGDPMIMRTSVIRRYVEPILEAGLDHVTSIRFGTKAPAYWPYRFTTDRDADDLLRLFEEVRDTGRNLALMSHYSHPVELSTKAAQLALRRIIDAGATVRCQAPLIRHVNDSSRVWSDMWTKQVQMGAIPYYMFVERNTGARQYFEVPLARAHEIFRKAYKRVSGLERTVRGPSMSAKPGKVVVDGIADVQGERVFVLRFVQGRNPEWVNRPFFAEFDPKATWLSDLRPAFGEPEFFFTEEMRTRFGVRTPPTPNTAAV
jgi:KamA family protein